MEQIWLGRPADAAARFFGAEGHAGMHGFLCGQAGRTCCTGYAGDALPHKGKRRRIGCL